MNGGSRPAPPPGGPPDAPAVTLEWRTHLPAPRDRVFAALTEASHLAEWFCDGAESETVPEGRLELRWDRPGPQALPYRGRWVHFDRPFACAHEGGHQGDPGGHAGRVSFVLEPDGPATLLTTRHVLPDRPGYAPLIERYRDAWPRALARLVAHLTPEP